MYRIKFPSGEEATIESPDALTDAVRKGTVTSYCFIMHQRSGQWLPIVRHPHYHQALTARFAADAAASTGAEALPTLLPDAIVAPAAAEPARSTPAALDVPNLDELFEMIDSPAATESAAPQVAASPEASPAAGPAAAAPPAPARPTPRGRSRDLEFLYVPETKPGNAPRPAGRTAGPPPRPAAPAPAPAPLRPAAGPAPKPLSAKPLRAEPAPSPARRTEQLAPTVLKPVEAAPAPAAVAPAAATPAKAPPAFEALAAETPAAEPPAAEAPAAEAPAAEAPAAEAPAAAPEPFHTAVATLEPPIGRRPEWLEDGLVDPVEAALSFDGPAPIELSSRRTSAPGSSRMLFMAVGLAVVLGGGLLAWSPWSGGPEEIAAAPAAAAPAPAAPAGSSAQPEAPIPVFADDAPAEEEPVRGPDVFDVAPDAPVSARTSFGGTAAQTPGAVIEIPKPEAELIPSAPNTARVAVPVVGEAGDRDSARLAELKRQITR